MWVSRRQTLALIGGAIFAPAPAFARDNPGSILVEEVAFTAPDGAVLRGALYRNDMSASRATIIVVHGAGDRPSRYEDWARIYAGAGFATLIYDKRGCGLSQGKYVRDFNTAVPNLRLLAADAVAAAAWIRAQPDLAGLPLGFAGPSQAGWIIPPAAKETAADFMIQLSGPVCKTSEAQEFEAQGDEGLLRYARFLREESETDPLPVLRELQIPGFWVFGEKDRNVPVDLCVRNLDALIAAGKPYRYFVDAEAGHFHGEPAHRRAITWLDAQLGA